METLYETRTRFANGYSAELTEDGVTIWNPNDQLIMDASIYGTDRTIRLSKQAKAIPIEGEGKANRRLM